VPDSGSFDNGRVRPGATARSPKPARQWSVGGFSTTLKDDEGKTAPPTGLVTCTSNCNASPPAPKAVQLISFQVATALHRQPQLPRRPPNDNPPPNHDHYAQPPTTTRTRPRRPNKFRRQTHLQLPASRELGIKRPHGAVADRGGTITATNSTWAPAPAIPPPRHRRSTRPAPGSGRWLHAGHTKIALSRTAKTTGA